MQEEAKKEKTERSEFMASLRLGALVGLALLVVIVPPLRMAKKAKVPVQPPVASAPATQQPPVASVGPGTASPGLQLADFKGEDASPEALLVANWAVATRDNKKHAFVIVDKADARVFVFGPDGKLKDSAPALLGAARGDDSFPGIGDKPLNQVRPEEKTTPAGRFVAEPGRNANGEDIVWVDYKAAVSMHRIRPLVAAERRLERLATRTIEDNRISFGCINLPVTFYEDVLSPTVKQYGAIVYVLPETRSAEKLFGAYDVLQAKAEGAHAQQVAFRR